MGEWYGKSTGLFVWLFYIVTQSGILYHLEEVYSSSVINCFKLLLSYTCFSGKK